MKHPLSATGTLTKHQTLWLHLHLSWFCFQMWLWAVDVTGCSQREILNISCMFSSILHRWVCFCFSLMSLDTKKKKKMQKDAVFKKRKRFSPLRYVLFSLRSVLPQPSCTTERFLMNTISCVFGVTLVTSCQGTCWSCVLDQREEWSQLHHHTPELRAP